MSQSTRGILFAIIACLLWSGNFIVARAIFPFIPPVTLAFLRWITATLMLWLVGRKHLSLQRKLIWQHKWYFLGASITGVVVFNTLLYVAGHYTSAVNMALIGTTSSPVFTFIIAAWLLHEKIPWIRLLGLAVCIAGIGFLVSKGSWENLQQLQFGTGDLWVLLAGLIFAFYNIFVRRKPAGFNAASFLFITFSIGTTILFPAMLIEQSLTPGIVWNWQVAGSILYIGAGASVAAFFCWNAAIGLLGAARTSIFGNLIPLFSSIEAVLLLNEKLYAYHWQGMILLAVGLLLANWRIRAR